MMRCVIVNLVYFDRCRLEKDYGFLTAAAALLALAALPPVLAEAAAAALLSLAALPPVLALPSHSTFAQPRRARTAAPCWRLN